MDERRSRRINGFPVEYAMNPEIHRALTRKRKRENMTVETASIQATEEETPVEMEKLAETLQTGEKAKNWVTLFRERQRLIPIASAPISYITFFPFSNDDDAALVNHSFRFDARDCDTNRCNKLIQQKHKRIRLDGLGP
jgi:hypothetical protein